jgi:hypothetical protein
MLGLFISCCPKAGQQKMMEDTVSAMQQRRVIVGIQEMEPWLAGSVMHLVISTQRQCGLKEFAQESYQ